MRKLNYQPTRTTISAAAGTVIAGAITAATLAIGPAPEAGSTAAHRSAGPFAMAGDLDRTSYQGSADTSGREIRQYQAHAQAADVASAARRDMARLRAMRLAAQRRARAVRAAAARQASAGRSGATHQTTASPVPSGRPQQIAIAMLGGFGWSSSQFGCLDSLWQRESGWNPYASNPASGAYGIPQAVPGSKMASAGSDWATDAATQIRWGLEYIRATYGSPCAAWGHETAYGSY